MLTESKAISQAKTIRDVYAAARECFTNTGQDCTVSFSLNIGRRGEWTDINVHRGNDCETGLTVQQAIAFFDVTLNEVEQLLPVVADITAGPDSDLEQLLKSFVVATVTRDTPDDRGVDWHTKSCDLNFDVVVIDVTLLEGTPDDQYVWEVNDAAYGERVLFRADLQKVERDADRVLAFYGITVEAAQ